jgi:hypothetical protein
MSKPRDILEAAGDGSVPGAVGLVARGGRVEVQAVGRGVPTSPACCQHDELIGRAATLTGFTGIRVSAVCRERKCPLDR